jgi:hypothetical protein
MTFVSGSKMMVLASGFALVSLLRGIPSAEATSLACHSVLSSPSAEQVEATLDGLARMKLSVDLEKAQGSKGNNDLSKTIKIPFQEKRQEFLKATGMDAKTFREEMRLRISRLQEHSKEEKKVEEKVREEVAPLLVSTEPQFQFVQSIALKDHLNFLAEMAYVEFKNGLLYTEHSYGQYKALKFMDLSTQSTQTLAKSLVAFRVSADHQTAYLLTHDGYLKTFSLQTLQETQSIKLEADPAKPNLLVNISISQKVLLDISPGGDKIMVSVDDNGVLVSDLSTGKYLASFGNIGTSKFLSDNEILLITNSSYAKYNLDTKIELKKELPMAAFTRGQIGAYGFDRDSGILLLGNGRGEILHINAVDMSINGETKFNTALQSFEAVPHSKGYYIGFTTLREDGIVYDKVPGNIYDPTSIMAHYKAAGYTPGASSFSADGRTMIILAYKDLKFSVDIWKDDRP